MRFINIDIYPEQIAFMIAIIIVLIGMYIAARIHLKNQVSISKEEDFISSYIRNKKSSLDIIGGISIETYLKILLIAPIVLMFVSFYITGNVFIALIFAAFGIRIPDIVVDFLKTRADKKFEERYSASLEQLGASLRAGKSIMQAVDDVADSPFIHPTMREKYARLSADLQMGISVKNAFKHFAEGTNSQDAKDVALAVDLQNMVGGREADVVIEISNTINQRIMLRKEIGSIFSSTSSMVWMMDFLPIFVILGFCMANRGYVDIYFSSTLNIIVLALCILMPLIGSFITHRTLSRIRRNA